MNEAAAKTRQFVEQEFKAHPHHSFGDWHVMYNHSLKVKELADILAKNITCDHTVVTLGALLHDIGKTYKASEEELHTNHESYNWQISRDFVKTLGLTERQTELLKEMLSEKSGSVEATIVTDADTLAFYADKELNSLFLAWAKKKGLQKSIDGKLTKYSRLKMDSSKKLGKDWHLAMKEQWSES